VSRLVVKLGGAVAAEAAGLVRQLADGGDEICVVHGAGAQISEEMERFGLPVEFVGGRRVTSRAALVLVRRSLASVNASLCAAIGPRAVGLLGDEIGLHAVQVPALGLVGDPLPSRPSAIEQALRDGLVPVVAPIGVSVVAGGTSRFPQTPSTGPLRGQAAAPPAPLNVNADEAAAALAVGLGAERILFVTDVPGVLLDGGIAQTLDVFAADRLLEAGELEGGIVPKVRAAIAAARSGVRAEIGATAVVA
jgi:acetylglutamate kinase